MNGDEEIFPGGLSNQDNDDWTQVHLQENGPDTFGNPMTYALIFVSGSSHYGVYEVKPEELLRLAGWMTGIAWEAVNRKKR